MTRANGYPVACSGENSLDVLINFGVAGGYTKDASQGNIVIVDAVMNSASKKVFSQDGKKEVVLSEYQRFIEGDDNDDIYMYSDRKLSDLAKNVAYQLFEDKIVVGKVASSDTWNASEYTISELIKVGAICEEMELFAMYSVGQKFGVPQISFKGISNNEILKQPYNLDVAGDLEDLVIRFIEEL